MQSFAALDESDPYSPRVIVEGKQYVDGRVERWISVYAPAGERLDGCGGVQDGRVPVGGRRRARQVRVIIVYSSNISENR